jgi:hypothetical protein
LLKEFLLKSKKMDRENIEFIWEEISYKLRNRFTKLTEADVSFIKGKEEDLLKRIELRTGKTRNEVLTLIKSL